MNSTDKLMAEMAQDFDRQRKVIKAHMYFDKLDEHYQRGFPKGYETGWVDLDSYFKPTKGKLIIVTGIPSHGKSAWIDNLMVKMIEKHNFKVAFFSPENLPLVYHFQKLAEIYINKPFFGENRMSLEEKNKAANWIDDHFMFILPDDGWTPRNILAYVESMQEIEKIDCLICDPYNEFEHKRPVQLSETEYISETLSLFRTFARKHKLLFFLVAHPQKLTKTENDLYPVPTPYNISGSAHWFNKADICLSIYRYFDKNLTELHIQKMRFKVDGSVGKIEYTYDYLTNTFKDSFERAQ